MTEAAKRTIEFAFNDLNLNRVNVFASTKNKASNKVIQKLGFVFEGIKRQSMRSKATGLPYDTNTYGLLKEDWKKSGK